MFVCTAHPLLLSFNSAMTAIGSAFGKRVIKRIVFNFVIRCTRILGHCASGQESTVSIKVAWWRQDSMCRFYSREQFNKRFEDCSNMFFLQLGLHGVAVLFCLVLQPTSCQLFAPIFSSEGQCCQSPKSCDISDCGDLNTECCRLADCNESDSFEGILSIPLPVDVNQSESDNDISIDVMDVYIAIMSTHIYIEYSLPSHRDDIALALSSASYRHPVPDRHFSLFASDVGADGEWRLMDVIAESGSYSILNADPFGEYLCPSRSGYCLSSRINNFNSQQNYELFHFV